MYTRPKPPNFMIHYYKFDRFKSDLSKFLTLFVHDFHTHVRGNFTFKLEFSN